MKRAYLRKVKPGVSSPCSVDSSADQPEQGSRGVRRRARTSAAMVGLALSMGATGLVLPRQSDGAAAAESAGTEATASPIPQASAPTPQEAISQDSSITTPSSTLVQHTVAPGETLHRLARKYQVTVGEIAKLNKLSTRSLLQVGQVLKVPARVNSQLEALTPTSDKAASDSLQAERQQALDKLRLQREQLQSKLTGLRSESSAQSTQEADSEAAPGALSKERHTPIAELPPTSGARPEQAAQAPALPRPTEQPSEQSAARVSQVSQPQTLATAAQIAPQPSIPSSQPEPDWIRSNQDLLMPSSPAAAEPAVPNDLLALRTASAPVTQPTIPQVNPHSITYRVNPGDTIAEIARAHNITQSQLISANRISDPNIIFVGQSLQIPSSQPTAELKAASAPATVIAMRTEPSVVSDQVAGLGTAAQPPNSVTVPTIASSESPAAPSLLPQQVAAAPISATPATPASLTLPATTSEANSSTSATQINPFVQNLMAEIRTLRQQRQQDANSSTAPQAQETQAVATPAAPATIAAASSGSTVVNPQFQRRNSSAVEASASAPATSQPQMVAAAPLGSENYEPLLRPIAGRMVSPDLPPLPGADNFLPNQREVFDGYIWPARGMLTSGYGWRWGRMHRGIDIAADVGTPIHAAADGVVEFAGWNSGGYGNMIEIRHADGSMTRYAHLNRIQVRAGQRIEQSQQIGEMGSTGFSTGPHLHFEVHLANQGTVNPISFLPGR